MLSSSPCTGSTVRCSKSVQGVGSVQIGDQPQVVQMQLIRNLVRSKGGATAIEYALIAGMIALVIVAAVSLTGTNLSTEYAKIGNALN